MKKFQTMNWFSIQAANNFGADACPSNGQKNYEPKPRGIQKEDE